MLFCLFLLVCKECRNVLTNGGFRLHSSGRRGKFSAICRDLDRPDATNEVSLSLYRVKRSPRRLQLDMDSACLKNGSRLLTVTTDCY